jgi:hypothetical protein
LSSGDFLMVVKNNYFGWKILIMLALLPMGISLKY